MQSAASVETPASNSRLFRFVGVAIVMFLVWFFGYKQWLALDGKLDMALCIQIANAGVGLLQTLGFPASIAADLPTQIVINGNPAVFVAPPCNGLVLYALFAGFVLAFQGPVKRMLWFIPLGIALIWAINIVRVAALAVNHYYANQSVDFNHHYTFTFVVYGFIFGLWMLWARRLSVPVAAQHSPALTEAASA